MNRRLMFVLSIMVVSTAASGCSLLIERAVPECQHREVLAGEPRSKVLKRMGTPTTIEVDDRLVDTFEYSDYERCSIWHGLSGGTGGVSGGYGPGAGALVAAVVAIGETASYVAILRAHFGKPDHEMTVYYDSNQNVERVDVALLPHEARPDPKL